MEILRHNALELPEMYKLQSNFMLKLKYALNKNTDEVSKNTKEFLLHSKFFTILTLK